MQQYDVWTAVLKLYYEWSNSNEYIWAVIYLKKKYLFFESFAFEQWSVVIPIKTHKDQKNRNVTHTSHRHTKMKQDIHSSEKNVGWI